MFLAPTLHGAKNTARLPTSLGANKNMARCPALHGAKNMDLLPTLHGAKNVAAFQPYMELKTWPNSQLYEFMRIITGCMRPTETTFLPVLAGITPPDIRREACVARITATAKNNSDRLLHHKVTAVDAACPQKLVSCRPFSRHAARLCNDNYDPAKAWSDRVDNGPPLIRTACP